MPTPNTNNVMPTIGRTGGALREWRGRRGDRESRRKEKRVAASKGNRHAARIEPHENSRFHMAIRRRTLLFRTHAMRRCAPLPKNSNAFSAARQRRLHRPKAEPPNPFATSSAGPAPLRSIKSHPCQAIHHFRAARSTPPKFAARMAGFSPQLPPESDSLFPTHFHEKYCGRAQIVSTIQIDVCQAFA